MPILVGPPPQTPIDSVTDVLHGVMVDDPFRWLEDQNSPATREWLRVQKRYTRSHLDGIPDRHRIRSRIHEFLAVETYDSVQIVGHRYVFRKRLAEQEQACIYLREGPEGKDQLLLDPAKLSGGKYLSVRPLLLSQDGNLLLYETRDGGERMGTFQILDIPSGETLSDAFPRGYLRGFAFTRDCRGFDYVHEPALQGKLSRSTAYRHEFGTSFDNDHVIFSADGSATTRLQMIAGNECLGFLVYRFVERTYTDFYLWPRDGKSDPKKIVEIADYMFGPRLLDDGRIVAITNSGAPNLRIVEVRQQQGRQAEFVDLVPTTDHLIENWIVTKSRIFVSYLQELRTRIAVFDLDGRFLHDLAINSSDTVRMTGGSCDCDELIVERESFTKPIEIWRYPKPGFEPRIWARKEIRFEECCYWQEQVCFEAQDGTEIPMFLVGQRKVLEGGPNPTIMTAYGGYGTSMTPQFSVFAAYLMERGCVFALPNIRGGSEFGAAWHEAAKRRKRQVAFDDFIHAAEWLIATRRTEPAKLAIFGGSNSGLLVGAALTQRPELFRAVVCMAPLLDMLRYHLFDGAYVWKDEFGTSEDPADFPALAAYSPYHRVRCGVQYPATMLISGDADQNCNPMHARKMTARLQMAGSAHPVILDYSEYRGHSPVLPLSERIDGLTDRLAFVCGQLGLAV